MRRLSILALLLAASLALEAQTLRSLLLPASTATVTLAAMPMGTYQWSFRVHGLPTVTAGADTTMIDVDFGTLRCRIPANTLQLYCNDNFDSATLGNAIVSFAGLTDIRVVATRTRDATYGTQQIDLWAGDCTGHVWSRMPALYAGGEPATDSNPLTLGSATNAFNFDFFRSTPTPVSPSAPTCPADNPTAIATNFDWRFEGDTRTDVSTHAYALSASGSFANSIGYNPASIILGSWTAPRPVVALAPFTLDGSKSITAITNGVPASYAWTQISGPGSSTIATPAAASTVVTPLTDGSYVYQLVVTDANALSGTSTVNVGVVNSDANGLKVYADPLLGYVLGPMPRYGVNPWPWYDWTEALNMETLAPYWAATPAPGSLFAGTGANDGHYSGRGAFLGTLTDTYDVKITGTAPDTIQWRKNAGAYSANQNITVGGVGKACNTLTDGVVICFDAITGHVVNDTWTRQAPYTGTASISGAAPNTIDGATGYVCGAACGSTITVVGTGTTWSSGTALQKLTAGDTVWLEWDAPDSVTGANGTNTGRWLDTVVAVADNTHFTINGSGGFWSPPIARSATMTVQKVGTDLGGYTQTAQPNASWNYYEALLGGLRVAAATNLTTYDTQSSALCNLWWQYGLGHGLRGTIQRNSGYQSMIGCAVKYGYTNAYWATFAKLLAPPNPLSAVARDAGNDIREQSYSTRSTAIMTHLYPAHTGAPAATTTTWCGYLANELNYYWLNPSASSGIYSSASGSDTYFQENLCLAHCGFPAAGAPPGPASAATFGTSPWRDSGLATDALIEAQKTLKADCANPTLAATVSTAITNSSNFIWDYGRSADGGLYYNVQYGSMQGIHPGDVIHQATNIYDAAINVTVAGGTAVTGTGGTFFLKQFAPCDGTSKIAISGGAAVVVSSCASDTALTLGSAVTNGAGQSYANPGTIAVTNGSAAVVGTGTGFVTFFAPCDGSTYIGIRGNTFAPFSNADDAVYKVASCADQTHLTLSRTYAGTTQAALPDYVLSKASTAVCTPSLSAQCETDLSSGRNLAADYPVAISWNLLNTGSGGPAAWTTKTEYALGKLYGGPTGGPGTLGAGVGPSSDGTVNNFDAALPACVTTPAQPCTFTANGASLTYGHAAKEFGMSAGAGNARVAIANYLIRNSLVFCTITPATLPAGRVATNYGVQVLMSAGCGAGPLTWTVSAGTLPPGLAGCASVIGTTCAITGTPTTTAGSPFSFSIRVTDGVTNTATQAFTVSVTPACTFTPSTLPAGIAGTNYGTQTLTPANCGGGTLTWTIPSGTLPAGLTGCANVTGATCAITGTPTTAAGSPFAFSIRVSDGGLNVATQAYSIAVTAACGITPVSLPAAVVGAPYSATLTANACGAGPLTWTVPVGTLPPGLTGCASVIGATCAITGTPTTSVGSPASLSIRVTDGAANTATQPLVVFTPGSIFGCRPAAPQNIPATWKCTF